LIERTNVYLPTMIMMMMMTRARHHLPHSRLSGGFSRAVLEGSATHQLQHPHDVVYVFKNQQHSTRSATASVVVRHHSSSSSSSATATATNSSSRIFPLSLTGLGLEPSFVPSHVLSSIAQLPEIKSFLNEIHSKNKDSQRQQQGAAVNHYNNIQIEQEALLLERARDVFGQYQAGGHEHQAVLALLAEHQLQRRGDCPAAAVLETLQQLRDYCDNARSEMDVLLAISKTHWLHGEFDQALAICDSLLLHEEETETTPGGPVRLLEESLPLHYAAARNGQALSRILLAATLDDAFSLRDPSRMTIKFLERQQQQQQQHHGTHHHQMATSLALVAAQLNLGAAEVVYADIIRRAHDHEVDAVPLDGAFRAWRRGLELLQKNHKHQITNAPSNHAASFLLKARLQTSMALTLLSKSSTAAAVIGKNAAGEASSQSSVSRRNAAMGEADLSRASELASSALKIYDHPDNPIKEGLGRTLGLVATCYHRAGQAVTAEGLFQSAISSSFDKHHDANPLAKLETIGTLQAYADLLRDWDRREGDAQKYEAQAAELHASLPNGWQGKSGIYSALWFWTPGTFLY
jgi:hypothetical protein